MNKHHLYQINQDIKEVLMKKSILILTLTLAVSYTALADAVTYDSAEEIIERIKFESRHK